MSTTVRQFREIKQDARGQRTKSQRRKYLLEGFHLISVEENSSSLWIIWPTLLYIIYHLFILLPPELNFLEIYNNIFLELEVLALMGWIFSYKKSAKSKMFLRTTKEAEIDPTKSIFQSSFSFRQIIL